MSVTRKEDVPYFGPTLQSCFDFRATESGELRKFLLVKAINGENAGYLSTTLAKLTDRTRVSLLDNVVKEFIDNVEPRRMSFRKGACLSCGDDVC